MRRYTDSVKYNVISSNQSFAKEHQFKQLVSEALLRKNTLLSNMSFTKFNNTLIVNLHILYRTKRLLYYRKKLKFKRKFVYKNRRKVKKLLTKYGFYYLKTLKKIKSKILKSKNLNKNLVKDNKNSKKNKNKNKKIKIKKSRKFTKRIKFNKRIYTFKKSKLKLYVISKVILRKLKDSRLSFRVLRKISSRKIMPLKSISINKTKKKSNKKLKIVNHLDKKFLITNFLGNTNYTDLKFRIFPLNYNLRYLDLAYFFKKLRYFQRNIFIRGYSLFLDVIKATTLLIKESISLKTYVYLLGLVFENIHKKKHNVYLRFIQTLLNIMFVYIKRLKNKAFVRSTLLGIKIQINGKLKGKDRAKVVRYSRGNLYTSSASVKLHFARYHAHTKYGVFGLTMWASFRSLNKKILNRNILTNQISQNLFSRSLIKTDKNNFLLKKQKNMAHLIKKNLKSLYLFLCKFNSKKNKKNKKVKNKRKNKLKNEKQFAFFLERSDKKSLLKQFILEKYIRAFVKNNALKSYLVEKYFRRVRQQRYPSFFTKFLMLFLLRKKRNTLPQNKGAGNNNKINMNNKNKQENNIHNKKNHKQENKNKYNPQKNNIKSNIKNKNNK